MARVRREELDAVGRLADPARHDAYSELALQRALEEYLPRRREPVAPLHLEVDGVAVPNLYRALADPAHPFETMRLERTGPEPGSSRWEFLRPFDVLAVGADGAAEATRADAPPVRAMARFVLREHYTPSPSPGPKGSAAPPRAALRPELFTPPALARYVRATGIVPFALDLAVYYAEERVRYEVDLVDSALLLDLRTHRLPPRVRVARPSRVGHAVDVLVAHGELSLPSARALEAVVESNGLSTVDLAPLFGGVRELGSSALTSLVARRLVALDRRTGLYRPRLENLAPGPERPRARETSAAPRSNPRLRTSVMELIAAAESRASCPLCGDPLPRDWKGLLCAKCQALVGAGAPGSTA